MRVALQIRRALFARQERGWLVSVAAAAAFAYVVVNGHAAHEMWRDELHCWAIGRSANGLWDLLTGERRYDGHPFLWYYLLHLVSRVNRSYVGLHVVSVVLAVGAVLLWLRYAPLPRLLRVLLLGSYYVVYEYGVISRSYILGVGLTFAFCALYRPYRVRYVTLSILLALLAATSLYGTLMAAALGGFLFTRGLRTTGPNACDDRRKIAVSLPWITAVVLLLVATALIAVTTWPPVDARYAPHGAFEFSLATYRADFARYWAAMFPFQSATQWDWIRTDYLGSSLQLSEAVRAWLGFGWFAAWLLALRRCPSLALAYAAGILMMMAVQHGVYPAGLRHLGHYFILLLACLWLYGRETRLRGRGWLLPCLLAVNLTVQALTGFAALRTDRTAVFSDAVNAAHFIQAHHLENQPMVAHRDEPTAPIAVILDRPFLFVGSNETSDFVLANIRADTGNHAEAMAAASQLAATRGPTLLILNAALAAPTPPGFSAKLLYRSGTPIVWDERYWIYEVRKAPAAPSPTAREPSSTARDAGASPGDAGDAPPAAPPSHNAP